MRVAILLVALAACQSSDVSREIGARCDTGADCDERCLPPTDIWPGGFCTTHCESDNECPSDAACLEEEGGICAFICTSVGGCGFLGEGYICADRDGRNGAGIRSVCRGG